jgi:LysR family nitrogen assimilation transcriptional regulator
MDLRLLEHFLRIVDFGSINRAAKELGLSQPTAARSLTQLERDLGQRLVLRRRTGISLTDAGHILASRAEQLLRQAASIREELENEPAGRVVVGMPFALRELITYSAVQEMRKSAPKSAIRVYEGLNVFLQNMLAQGLLDLAVLAAEQVSDADFEQNRYVREGLVLARSRALPRPPDPVPLDEITRYPCTMPGRPNIIRAIVERAVGTRNLTNCVAIEAETQELCIEFVRRGIVGQTVTIGSGLVNRNRSGLHVAQTENLVVTWAIAVNRQRRHLPSVRRLKSILERILIEKVKSGAWHGASLVD